MPLLAARHAFGDAERGQEGVPRCRVAFGEGPEEAEAAGDHHVAVRHGEVRLQPAAPEFAALRAGDSDDRPRFALPPPCSLLVRVVDAVALAVEHVLVWQPAGEQALCEVLDLPG